MSENKVVDVILHCQKQFKKDNLPEEKILHYLGRLSRLRVTIQDLAETGIGRTVNSLSRNDGPVGQVAEKLVRGWKQMVSDQQSQEVNGSEDDSESNSGTSDEDDDEGKNPEDVSYEIDDNQGEREPQFSQKQSFDHRDAPSDVRDYDEDDDIDDIDDPYMDDGFLTLANNEEDDEDEEDANGSSSEISDQLQIDDEGGHHASAAQEDIVLNEKQPAYQQQQRTREIIDERHHKYQSKNIQSIPNPLESSKKSYDSSSSKSRQYYDHEEKDHSSIVDHREISGNQDKHQKHSSKSRGESSERSSKHRKHDKSHHASSTSSSSDKTPEKSKRGEPAAHQKEKHRSKEHSSHHKREKERSEKDQDKHHHKEKSGSSSQSSRKSSPDGKKPETSADRKRKDESEASGSSSSHSSKKSKIVLNEAYDSTSGVKFADVLGSLNVPSNKNKKGKREEPEKSHRYLSSNSGSSHQRESSKSSKHSRDKSSSSSRKHEDDSKVRSSSKPTKIESVIKPLASITPHYKPLSSSSMPSASRPSTNGGGVSSGLAAPITLSQSDLSDISTLDYWEGGAKGMANEVSQADAISTMLSSRNARSKVFSGVKAGRRGEVPSLFDLCMQVIKDNIGELGFTGGIPYDILKPALERANPQQLMLIEGHNDYLIGETDELWQFHCKRDFRGQAPSETESWRELYERCTEEQNIKLERVKKQMKKAIETAQPVRKAKLAYVETSVGGPRFNKQKAQTIKNGMKTLKTIEEKGPSRGISSSASVGFNNPKGFGEGNIVVQEASVIIAPESRSAHAAAPPVSRESTAKLKPKKAPLMQKTMKLIRSLNRR